ncbi:UbiA family prenyltransferase [Kitasatospora sp. NPDC048365]|uniref:UbiA family prenyltransferase n=1 Tax=Kitasatospora sp. NPDC048365 TaxID=3364050 RepID=UPI0037172293
MTVLAGVLAAAVGRGAAGTALVVAAVGAGQLSVGWSNDWIDVARDRTAGRVDKPLAVGELPPRSVAVAAGCALVLCVLLSLASGLLAGSAHLVGVAAGWAYNVRLKRTVLSWLPYALAFGLLPAFVVLGLPGGPRPPGWVLGAGALLGAGAHFANVLPDLDEDRAAGVLGLPQRLGRVASGVVAAVLLTAATVVLAVGPPGPPGPAAWAALAVTVPLALAAVVAPRSRLPFVAAILAAAVDVALLVGTAFG